MNYEHVFMISATGQVAREAETYLSAFSLPVLTMTLLCSLVRAYFCCAVRLFAGGALSTPLCVSRVLAEFCCVLFSRIVQRYAIVVVAGRRGAWPRRRLGRRAPPLRGLCSQALSRATFRTIISACEI